MCLVATIPATCRSTSRSGAPELRRLGVAGAVLALAVLAGGAWLVLRPPPEGRDAGPAEAPVEFVRGNSTDPESLDPLHARSEPALNIMRDLHEGLVSLDAAGEQVPAAARRWTVSADGLAWRFEIDPAARWSDGQPVVAEHFVTTFRMLGDPATASPHGALFLGVQGMADALAGRAAPADIGVVATAPDQLEIRLAAPLPWLPALLAHPAAVPRRSDVPSDGKVSSGPFLLGARVPGSHVLLLRNPAYRDAAAVAIDQVRYLSLGDQASELSRYRAGEIDMTYTVPVSRVPWLREHLADEFRVSPYLAVYFYGFNTRRPPLDDPRVRRALSLAIDRDLIASRITGAGEQPACTLVPPVMRGYPSPVDTACEARRRERVERAVGLMREAGYGPDRPLELEIRYNTGELHDRIAVAVSAMWQEALGVTTRLVGEEFRVLLENVRGGEVTQVYRGSWIADFAAPESFLHILAGDNPVNGTGWADESYDELLAAARLADDDTMRMTALAAAEARALEATPLMPLFFYVSKKLVKPHVCGIEDNALNIHPSRYVSFCRDATST